LKIESKLGFLNNYIRSVIFNFENMISDSNSMILNIYIEIFHAVLKIFFHYIFYAKYSFFA